MVTFEINGKTVQAENGKMLIEVTDDCGIHIPRFCYHKNLSIAANCRMCLVEVEKAPKPMPACATPVAEGMKVFTKSTKALAAQKAVMEFLLINHPLDCPVCDQGGECDLQDFSIGYGEGTSQYVEVKRVVKDKDIGPLISTEMTRCIHCTRCVRFGQEVAGIREMGVIGRGEHMEIGTYVEKTIDSELSANIIDLCPVGALTSKPFRYNARSWEMDKHNSIAAHDCVGSNIEVHTLRGEIQRVIARENPAINETWISDRDRFSYLGLNHNDRISTPMIKVDNNWQECSWEDALNAAVDGIKNIVKEQGADSLGALISPSATTEELYLTQKLVRGIGSNNIDHRLRQSDYVSQDKDPLFSGLAMPINELATQQAFFIIASNTRKEQPIIAHFIRQATLKQSNSTVSILNPVDYPISFNVDTKIISAPTMLFPELKSICKALIEELSNIEAADSLADLISDVTVSEQHRQIIKNLVAANKSVVLLGSLSQTLPDFSAIRMLASFIAQHTQSTLSFLTAGANASGAYIAGAVPHRTECLEQATIGLATQQMFEQPLNAYIVQGIEAEYDIETPEKAVAALSSAFVVSISPYLTENMKQYLDVVLPCATFSESSGSFVNISGDWQEFNAVVNPLGESRPAWKILRVLGNLFNINNMDYISCKEVRDELYTKYQSKFADNQQDNKISWQCPANIVHLSEGHYRIGDYPIYSIDSIVRRSEPLQATTDGKNQEILRMNSEMAASVNLQSGQEVTIKQAQSQCKSTLEIDDTIPDNCFYLPHSTQQSSTMGCSFSTIDIVD
ncbi:MAG: NADH-quinone oxidoreductase subunit NuoG [Pseudomonadota bacterium]